MARPTPADRAELKNYETARAIRNFRSAMARGDRDRARKWAEELTYLRTTPVVLESDQWPDEQARDRLSRRDLPRKG